MEGAYKPKSMQQGRFHAGAPQKKKGQTTHTISKQVLIKKGGKNV